MQVFLLPMASIRWSFTCQGRLSSSALMVRPHCGFGGLFIFWLVVQSSCVAYTWTYIPHIFCQKFGIYALHSGHIYFWHTLGNDMWSINCSCFIFRYICGKIFGLYAHVACWLCELYLECGSHNCSVIYVKYVYTASYCLVGVSDLICGMCDNYGNSSQDV